MRRAARLAVPLAALTLTAAAPKPALAQANDAPGPVRATGAEAAVRHGHDDGLDLLDRRLAALAADPPRHGWELHRLLRSLEHHGPAAARLAPRVLPFLASSSPEVKVEAALALGRIGSTVAAPELIALESEFEDDWLLAYNAVESLGLIRSTEARPLLQRVARNHWHKAVRNNAARALGLPPKLEQSGEEAFYIGFLRHHDERTPPRWCGAAAGSRLLPQNPPPRAAWPQGGAQTLAIKPLSEAESAELARYKALPGSRRYAFALPLAQGGLVAGWDHGEFGGGIAHLRADGSLDMLSEDNAKFAFRMGGRLYVATGPSHLVSSSGALYVVDEGRPRLLRRIRLPADPTGAIVTAGRIVVIRTTEGDVAIAENGRLVDAEALDSCSAG